MLLQVPVEVTSRIFSLCDPASITQTCRAFAAIAYSTQSLWSTTQLSPSQLVPGAADHLRRRLQRAGALTLKVSIGPMSAGASANLFIINELCSVLSSFNLQINRMEVTAETALLAGHILSIIYSQTSTPFPALCTLFVQVTDDAEYPSPCTWPRLDKFLECTTFPMLKTLRISSHFDCIPVPPPGNSLSFDHLHTLILDGTMEQESPSIALIVNLLHSTPQLENLWLKTLTSEQPVTVMDATIPRSIKNAQAILIPVLLPNLTRLSITAPGAGTDLLHCIEAPVLHDVHLDGSRPPAYLDLTGEDFSWSQIDTTQVQSSLKRLATRSPELRRLAITSTYLSHEGWRWLLLGDGEGPPFPQLETLALHELEPLSGNIHCGFDDALLMEYARQPSVSLRRLCLRHCTFALGGSAVVRLFENVINGAPGKECELEIDRLCQGITEAHLDVLAKCGVKIVFHHKLDEELNRGESWSRGCDIDGPDSYAY